MPRLLFYCFFLLFLNSCNSRPSSDQEVTTAPPQIESAPNHVIDDQREQLLVHANEVRLRAQPGQDGEVVATAKKGEALFDLETVSNFSTRIELSGQTFNEPWLKVATKDGTKGWVYACPLFFRMEKSGQLATFLLEKKLEMLVGKHNAERLRVYAASYQNVNTEAGFATVFRAGLSLRDTIVEMLETKVEPNPDEGMPDLFWLNEIFPGYLPQLVAEGTAYYLFTDFRAFLNLANKTSGQIDNEFLDICITAFPEDSIEYFYPSWKIQTWDYGGHSLLGRGKHMDMLGKMDKLLKQSDLFKEEIGRMKQDILNDMTGSYVTYWEEKEKILAEIDTIIHSNYGLFSEEEKIALNTRKEQFEAPEEHDIEVNHRSGHLQ